MSIGIPDSSANGRRGAIDVARSFSLILVVVAHLAMVVIDRASDGSLRGVNLFELYPRFEWITMLSPMPLFFVASGWANVGSSHSSRRRRTAMLISLSVVLVVVWSTASLAERALTGGNGIVADGARVATQPLWFLTAWVPFTMFAPLLTRVARRPVRVIAVCLGLMATTDVLRFVGDAPRWIGFPGFFIAWSVPWLLGAWWRQRRAGPIPADERRIGALLAAAAAAAGAALVLGLGYRAALIDAVPGHRSNTTPPTLFTAVASLAQVGLFMAVARILDGVAARRSRSIRSLNAIAPGLYVWHLSALSLWAAVMAAGFWTPRRLSWQWWATRPAWFGLVLALAIGLSLASRPLLRIPSFSRINLGRTRPSPIIIPAALATVGFGLTGLYGPDTTVMALSISALCVLALVSLGGSGERALDDHPVVDAMQDDAGK